MKTPKIALAHDWLTTMGGAERVLLALSEIFPEAPIFTSVFAAERVPLFQGKKIVTTYLQKWPWSHKHQLYPHLRPRAIEQLDLRDFDIVISTSSAEMKGLICKPETMHICYLHTPTRYFWDQYHDYLGRLEFGLLNPLVRLVMPSMIHRLRQWDFQAAQRPDFLITNSKNSQRRAQKYYRRDSTVIFPPVDLERFTTAAGATPGNYFIYFSRLNPYKHADLAVQACRELNLPLKVVGEGPELPRLRQMAGKQTEFLGFVPDQDLPQLVASARAFIFPSLEDFGIVPLEAAAAGTPTVAFGAGGALETVRSGVTGEFFAEQTVPSLAATLRNFDEKKYCPADMQKWATSFSKKIFQEKIRAFVEQKWAEFQKR